MLVQARGTLIAVRLVPTPSSYSNHPSLRPATHVGVAPRLTRSFFAPLSFERERERETLNTGPVCRTLVV